MGAEQRRFELSVPQIVGSALAAVTAAVAASYLGVAGTVIGAAVFSVASTIGSAVYTHYLKRTGERVKQHTLVGRRDDSGEAPAGSEPAEPTGSESGEGGPTLVMPAVEEPRRRLPWVKVGAAAALVFAMSMGGILVYQAVAQQTVHEQITGKTPKKADTEDKAPAERTVVESDRPAYTPQTATQAPETPTPTPTPTATRKPTPTPTPTETDTVAPSPAPTTTAPPQEGERPDVVDEAPPSEQADRPDQADQAEPTATPAP
ncbi:hypothetical protein [Nonomuraea basaltis]|uniref:hypothetical protein n=1 Tax=Nonomuraea basaltis TaxID=2495887 RepID=UPI001486B249|nr:hypothetical protein [Nonomuraea basaltis]